MADNGTKHILRKRSPDPKMSEAFFIRPMTEGLLSVLGNFDARLMGTIAHLCVDDYPLIETKNELDPVVLTVF